MRPLLLVMKRYASAGQFVLDFLLVRSLNYEKG
jgi:hypothetical protein